MFDIAILLKERYRQQQWLHHPLVAKCVVRILRELLHEKDLRSLSLKFKQGDPLAFIDNIFNRLDFSYRLHGHLPNIPQTGRVVIIANHPFGTLDGLALLKILGEHRPDIKVVANNILSVVNPLESLLLPVDNMGGKTPFKGLKNIHKFLENNGALIIFPAGQVSRFGCKGIGDGPWHSGFLKIATLSRAPILPIHISGRNSLFFYALSIFIQQLSTYWLIREMFKRPGRCPDIHVGKPIQHDRYDSIDLPLREKVELFKRHTYLIGKNLPGIITDTEAVPRIDSRTHLHREIRRCKLIHAVPGRRLYLYRHSANSRILAELGKLRELSFKAAHQGTGKHRDIDNFDLHYDHLILWNIQDREIVGAYRLRDSTNARAPDRVTHLYSSTLFRYTANINPIFSSGLEFGRSFIAPKYWGGRDLHYLWQGIGAYLALKPWYRYLFGPVSISTAYPTFARNMLVFFYRQHFFSPQNLGRAVNPYRLAREQQILLAKKFPGKDYRTEFTLLKNELRTMNLTVPTLYKHYSTLCTKGGVVFADFNTDPLFSNCIDGLVIVDLQQVKAVVRHRYLTGAEISPAVHQQVYNDGKRAGAIDG